MILKKLLNNNTPFAIMQYFESFKLSKQETCRKYELIYLNNSKKISFKILDQEEIRFFKLHLNEIKPIIKHKKGCVYEFKKFKEYLDANKIIYQF